VWIEAAWKNGGDAELQIAQRTELQFKLGVGNYAVGGARPARCSEKESLGAACLGSDEYLVKICGVLRRSSLAAASAGMCNAWQIWQAVSGPFVCWWKSAPPAAK